MRLISLILIALLMPVALAGSVPLRGDFPDASVNEAIPLSGGIPFPQGAIKSVDNIRVLSGTKELPAQVSKLAVWPDASIKWAMVDLVVVPKDAQSLTLEFGPEVQRASVSDPLNATLEGADAKVSGGGVTALIKKSGGGVVDELTLNGKQIFSADKPARLHVDTLRIADGTSGTAFPSASFVCRDPNAVLDAGNVAIDSVSIESPGPIRATVLIRGNMLLPHFGSTLPKEVLDREPAGRMPFSMRISFYKGMSIVYGQHQIIFSGEPDCDFINHWGIELPGRAGPHGSLILEPGVTLEQTGDAQKVQENAGRLCYAPIQGGFGLIREGWQHRPCAITQENGSAWIDFWPRAAGVWDLRRYAREWAVGESGQGSNANLEHYARYAARGMAKSHNFVLNFNAPDAGKTPAAQIVTALSARALLLAPPAWYGSTLVLGPMSPEQTSGDYAAIDASARKHLDWYLYNQDLFRWHGKLVYGFFQSRFGEVHRYDRWDNDYGRWGLALNDGAGRFGHLLMQEFLRTLDRRYFDAGEAFNRINYDTNMVHTLLHEENCGGWWTAIGCCHRHNVQPFGCPYIGMRGSYPVGHRILHLLTGDGVIADGLDIVADSSFQYANGAGSRLCCSGGSDGEGSASNALLWKYETTGDKKYFDACRTILDKSGLVPPKDAASLGYGPSFGLFNAAGEYAELSNDQSFKDRVVALAKLGAKEKNPEPFVSAIAMGYRFSKDEELKNTLTQVLKKAGGGGESLADLPAKDWPGHGGFREPGFGPNLMRDVVAGIALLTPAATPEFPKPTPSLKPVPAVAPADWYKPGGAQAASEHIPSAKELLKPSDKSAEISTGALKWSAQKPLADSAGINGADSISDGIVPRMIISSPKTESLKVELTAIGPAGDGSIAATGKAGPTIFSIHMKPSQADGIPSMRIEAACQLPKGNGRIASWGLLIPLKLSGNGHEITSTAPGRFRLERCRLDQNDEKVPSWLAAMEGREKQPHWPKWREAGLEMGPGQTYRIWHSNREDTAPCFVDQGEGGSNWFDVTDRGGEKKWGVTVRVLRADASDLSRQAIRANMETGALLVEFHSENAEPLSEEAGAAGLSGACDVIFHDGWRPPLSKPELTAAQYEKFIDDTNIAENWGLNALRFNLSDTHKVTGRKWPERLRDLGIEPREIMYGMQRGGVLAELCKKVAVQWDANDVEASVQRVIEHYKK